MTTIVFQESNGRVGGINDGEDMRQVGFGESRPQRKRRGENIPKTQQRKQLTVDIS